MSIKLTFRMPYAASLCLFLLTCLCLFGNLSYADQDRAITSPEDKIQYAIGVEVARNFRNQGMDMDIDLVLWGMRDGLSGEKLLFSESELRNIIISVQSDIRRKRSLPKGAQVDDKKKVIINTIDF